MSVQAVIENKIKDSLSPEHLEVINESNQHNVPPGSESHFKITVVSEKFADKMLVARHRMINQLLAEELAGPIHALSMHTFTPIEWNNRNQQVAKSPPCLGGAKREQKSN